MHHPIQGPLIGDPKDNLNSMFGENLINIPRVMNVKQS